MLLEPPPTCRPQCVPVKLHACAGLKEADSVEKSVRIVITSGLVNQPRFSKALRESLELRVKQVPTHPACSLVRTQPEAAVLHPCMAGRHARVL